MATDSLELTCVICGEFADMDSPEDLCEGHWEDWFGCAKEWRCKVTDPYSRCDMGTDGYGWVPHPAQDGVPSR